jgi:putative PIN family toxin of toxin-antitoxin system
MRNNFFIFDTNVLLSALFNKNSTPGKPLIKARIIGTLLISIEIEEEYKLVFPIIKFKRYVPLNKRLAFIENIISISFPILIHTPEVAYINPKDDKYHSVAINGGAECIISSNKHLLDKHPFRGIPNLKTIDFLNDNTIFNPRY